MREKEGERWKKDECWDSILKEREDRWEGRGNGGRERWSRGRDYRGWVPVTRRRRRQRSLDGAPSMLINSFAHAVYRVHALIKREPAITIIPRICSDFLGRTSERRPSNVDGWMDGRCRLNDPGKRKKRKKKKRAARFDFLVRGNSLVGRNFWRRGRGSEKASGAYKIVCLARDISRVNQSATSVKMFFQPVCALFLSPSLFLRFSLASRWKIRIPGEGEGKVECYELDFIIKESLGSRHVSKRILSLRVKKRASPPLMKKATGFSLLFEKRKETKRGETVL